MPLTDLVAAVAGAKLTDEMRARLDARGAVRFDTDPRRDETRFMNQGPATRIRLKSFEIRVPPAISGRSLLDSPGGATLHFDRTATPSAHKLLASVRLQSLSVNDVRVLVGMESSVFDQCFDLV